MHTTFDCILNNVAHFGRSLLRGKILPRLPILSVADNKQSYHCTNVISFSVLLGAATFKTKKSRL